MCLPATFFAMFLTVVGPDLIESEPGRYIIHAENQDAHWVADGQDRWCTIAPQLDRTRRTAALRED